MLPNQIAKSGTEDAEQTALFAYVNAARLHGFEIADRWAVEGPLALHDSPYKAQKVETLPYLQWMHAIPNGGSRGDSRRSSMIRGAQLKATGVKKGVFDIFLPYPVLQNDNSGYLAYCGLYIEMKVRSRKPKRAGAKGGMSDDQLAFGEYARQCGYATYTCYGWEEAVSALKEYLGYGPS